MIIPIYTTLRVLGHYCHAKSAATNLLSEVQDTEIRSRPVHNSFDPHTMGMLYWFAALPAYVLTVCGIIDLTMEVLSQWDLHTLVFFGVVSQHFRSWAAIPSLGR